MVNSNSISISIISAIAAALVLLAAGVGIAVYFATYKRHINKALSSDGQTAGRVHRMPTVGSFALTLCGVAVIILMGFMLYTVISIGKRLDVLNDRMDSLSARLSSVYEYTNEAIKEQNTLLSYSGWEIGTYDGENHRAEIKFTVVPKSTSKEAELSISTGGETIPLSHVGGGRYEGTMDVDMFAYYDGFMLMISDDSGVRTEPLDFVIWKLWQKFFPSLYVKPELSEGGDGQNGAVLHISMIDAEHDTGHELVSLRLVTEVDGKKTDERDLTEYLPTLKSGKTYSADIDVVSGAGKVTVTLLATDGDGYTYEYFALEADDFGVIGVPAYDSDGVVLTKLRDETGKVIYSAE